jgi:hypothetical protein
MGRPADTKENGMAKVKNLVLKVTRDVANADIQVDYDIEWDAFDQATNLVWQDSYRLIGDDTGQDGDDGVTGDDSIPLGFVLLTTASSNGATSTHRTQTRTIAWTSLNEDTALGSALNNDDEIRAVVTLTPLLPVATSLESNLVLENV